MSEDNLKVTIYFPSLGKKVKTNTDTIQHLAKDLKNKRKRKELLKVIKCQHKKTVAINEEGHAGVYCVDCNEQLEKEC